MHQVPCLSTKSIGSPSIRTMGFAPVLFTLSVAPSAVSVWILTLAIIPSINVNTGTDNSSAPLVPVDVPCARIRLSVSDICSSAVSRHESTFMPKLLFIVLLRTT